MLDFQISAIPGGRATLLIVLLPILLLLITDSAIAKGICTQKRLLQTEVCVL